MLVNIISLSLLLTVGQVTSDLSASIAELRLLEQIETSLMDALDKYVRDTRKKLDDLEAFRLDMLDNRSKYDAKPDHPIGAFNIVKRFVTVWGSIVDDLPNNDVTDEYRQKIKSILESNVDFENAQRQIFRLQQTYNLSIPEMMAGVVLGRRSQPLSQTDAVMIGEQAVAEGEFDAGIEWLMHSKNHAVPPLVSLNELFRALSFAHDAKARDFARKAVEFDVDITDTETLEVTVQKTYHKLCRESMQDTVGVDLKLGCHLKRSVFDPFRLYKIEQLHLSPFIAMYYDILTDQEADNLISTAMQLQAENIRPYTKDDGATTQILQHIRLVTIHEASANPVVVKMLQEISEATGMKTTLPLAEPLEVNNYGIGGHFVPHVDSLGRPAGDVEWNPVAHEDRMATMIFYLTDVELGGSTVFLNLKVGIKPRKNAALVWFNYDDFGYLHGGSFHAGCPVLVGEKWLAVKHIESIGNELNRPCPRRSNES